MCNRRALNAGSPTKAVFSHSDFISPSAALHASSMPAPVANLVKPQPRRVPLGGANEGFLSSPAGDDVKKRFEQLSRESPMPRVGSDSNNVTADCHFPDHPKPYRRRQVCRGHGLASGCANTCSSTRDSTSAISCGSTSGSTSADTCGIHSTANTACRGARGLQGTSPGD